MICPKIPKSVLKFWIHIFCRHQQQVSYFDNERKMLKFFSDFLHASLLYVNKVVVALHRRYKLFKVYA